MRQKGGSQPGHRLMQCTKGICLSAEVALDIGEGIVIASPVLNMDIESVRACIQPSADKPCDVAGRKVLPGNGGKALIPLNQLRPGTPERFTLFEAPGIELPIAMQVGERILWKGIDAAVVTL